MRYIPLQAFNFSFNDFYLSLLTKFYNPEVSSDKTKMKFIAGGLAGASSFMIVFPIDCCQTKIISDIGTGKTLRLNQLILKMFCLDGRDANVKREYTSLRHCVRSVVQVEGVKGFYAGARIGIIGIIIYRSLYFGLFDLVKRVICGEQALNQHGKPMKMSLWLSFLTAQVRLNSLQIQNGL